MAGGIDRVRGGRARIRDQSAAPQRRADDRRPLLDARDRSRRPSNIVIVAIDNATLQELNEDTYASEFPFPRRYDAQVIDTPARGRRPRDRDRPPVHPADQRNRRQRTDRSGRPRARQDRPGDDVSRGPTEKRRSSAATSCSPKSAPGRRAPGSRSTATAAVRRFPYRGPRPEELRRRHTGSGERPGRPLLAVRRRDPADRLRRDRRNRSGRSPTRRCCSAQYPPNAFLGKTVILGATAPVLQDVHSTATTNGAVMSGPEMWANADSTLQARGAAARRPRLARRAADRPARRDRPARQPAARRRCARLLAALAAAIIFTIATQVAFNNGRIIALRLSAARARDRLARHARGRLPQRGDRARAGARPVRAVRAPGRRRTGRRAHRRQPAPRRGRTRLHGAVLRPARVHELLRDPARVAGHRCRQLLPERNDRSDPGCRRNADLLHGRRDHGGVRRAARAA